MELSIVIPCLNEVETLGICISKCKNSLKKMKIKGEIVIADNGSKDGSIQLAKSLKVKVINVKKKGYGYALIEGIKKARGKYVIMADADNSYDFNKINNFYSKLKSGFDIVQGCRFSYGGGEIKKKAMPISHRYLGNPLISFLSKLFFSLPFSDVYCGYRGFDRIKFLKLKHFSGGMVFAIENLIKFKVSGAKCTEIPVTLHKDGRKKNRSHLNTFSDGWITLKFLIISCPKWLFFFPSIFFLIMSFYSINKLSDLNLNQINFINFEIISSSILYFLLSFQIFMFGLFSSLTAVKLKMLESKMTDNFFKIFKIKYAFGLSFLIFFLLFIDNKIVEVISINEYLRVITNYLLAFFAIMLIINSLFISLITLDEQR